MRSLFKGRAATKQDNDDWQKEMAAWGVTQDEAEDEPDCELWAEHVDVMTWWLSIPNFLSFNQCVCTGMNVLAVKADADLSGREVIPSEYELLKLIAKTLTEEINRERQ